VISAYSKPQDYTDFHEKKFDAAITFLLRSRKGKNHRLLMDACVSGTKEDEYRRIIKRYL
jgi:hypothetical protein